MKTLENSLMVLLLVIVGLLVFFAIDQERHFFEPNGTALPENVLRPEVIQTFDLAGKGFHQLYEELSMPNTIEQVNLPEITGNDEADKHIREMAEERGYLPRRIVSVIEELQTLSGGEVLQPQAKADFEKLALAAKDEGVTINVRSGYRDLDQQRQIFMTRLFEGGIVIADIASGTQDVAIDTLLRTTAPPGYSRHHTGYTVDLVATDNSIFANSKGFAWISRNNYENALLHGYIPSYPDGAENQGPNPEPWEFVWVGTDLIETQIDSSIEE